VLLEQKPEHQIYLESFLKNNPVPWISWIQDIYTDRFDAASRALESVARSEVDLKKQHVCLF
jgi:hypothetical protein